MNASGTVLPGLSFLLGIGVGVIWEDIPLLTLDTEVNLVAVAALASSLALSIVFFRHIERAKQTDQLTKSTLLDRITDSILNIKAVDELCQSSKINHRKAISQSTKCRREFNSFVAYSRSLDIEISGGTCHQFEMACAELKDLITATSPDPLENPPVRISNGEIELSSDRRVEVERKVDEGLGLLYELQREIIEA